MNIPGRVLLDTNVLNFTLDWGEAIFEGGDIPGYAYDRDAADILALEGIFMTGRRAAWQLAISPSTYYEISATSDPARRAALERWFGELWYYWREIFEQEGLSDAKADSLARRMEPYDFLACFPQRSDRELISHAIAYNCDGFCTRDWRTILNHRHKVRCLNLHFLSPAEWWEFIRPYAPLWV